MTTYRERREARVERLRGWADKRETRAEADQQRAEQIGERFAMGQPIITGHHSERGARRDQSRMHAAMSRSVESSQMAERMRGRADNIEAAAEHAIYSDDEDAIERLRERIAGLEAERERIKAYNATCRKGAPDLSILTPEEKADLLSTARSAPYMLGAGGQFPAYRLTNLGGNINRNRKRLADLERKQA